MQRNEKRGKIWGQDVALDSIRGMESGGNGLLCTQVGGWMMSILTLKSRKHKVLGGGDRMDREECVGKLSGHVRLYTWPWRLSKVWLEVCRQVKAEAVWLDKVETKGEAWEGGGIDGRVALMVRRWSEGGANIIKWPKEKQGESWTKMGRKCWREFLGKSNQNYKISESLRLS